MENLIEKKLNSSGALFRVHGILQCVNQKEAALEYTDVLIGLQQDMTVVAGRTVSDYATALLDYLGIKHCNNLSEEVAGLIKAMPDLAAACV